MSKTSHDPSEYVRGLQQLLVSDKKRIGFLFGAGTSLAKKNDKSVIVPAISEMTRSIELELSKNSAFRDAILEIRSEIGDEKFNIESFLTNIEVKRNVLVEGKLNGLTRDGFNQLILEIKKK